jgi:hypothetical protein
MSYVNPASFSMRASIITISILLIFSASSSTIIQQHQAFARCPNGTHKSPSGDCEPVVPHTGLSRCPNGFHRSPSGDCEQVRSLPSESDVGPGSTKFNQNDNSIPGLSSPSPLSSPLSSSRATTSSNQCDQTLWKHVYNPTRLQVVDTCKSVLGVIESKRVEKDGDYHIRVKLDPPFSNLINSANIKNQFGDLVVEPICVNRVTQADAISACQNFHQNISIPPIGSHVNITGSYVLDKEHGNWAEIHPVTSIKKIP